jgi:Ca2+-binding RTX toxin-like protein
MADQDWEVLEDSYWYVPTAYLGAFAASGGSVMPRVDQTLWHITNVVDSYVFGEVRTTLGNGWVTSTLVGSIAPSGAVSFSFADGTNLTTGTGHMVERDGEWYFEMQMTTGSGVANVSHWAYMAEVEDGDRAWDSLPGFTGTGVEAAFDAGSTNDDGAEAEQMIVFGGNGSDDMDSYTSTTGVLLYGEGGNDAMSGTGLADGIVGGRGADTISAGAGDDDLVGQIGGDTIKGGDGSDLIMGGRGNDTLSGNAGSDLFTFATGEGNDVIKDFDAKGGGDNQDYIGVGSDVIEWLQVFQYGDDTVISFSDDQTVVLIGVKASSLGEEDFMIANVV